MPTSLQVTRRKTVASVSGSVLTPSETIDISEVILKGLEELP